MNKQEISKLFNRIKNHYNTFTTGDEKIEEWYKFLKDYDSKEINKSLDNYLTNSYDNPPLVYHLTKGLSKIETPEESSWITECDICKQRIKIYNNDMREYEKHFRRCSKIDFIDTISMKFRNKHISSVKYYEMSDTELDSVYHQIMNFYLQNKDNKDKKEIFNSFQEIGGIENYE